MPLELILSLVRTTLARGIAAIGGVCLFISLGRLHGAEGVGLFTLAFSIYMGVGLLARYGMDSTLTRYIGQAPFTHSTQTYLAWALKKGILISVPAAGCIFLSKSLLSDWFGTQELKTLLPAISLAIPSITINYLLAGFMKAVRKPAIACSLESGMVSLVTTLLILAQTFFSQPSIVQIAYTLALASWSVSFLGIWETCRWLSNHSVQHSRDRFSYKDFNKTSSAFFVTGIAYFSQTVISVWLASFFLSSPELGLFKATERLALLISFIAFVLNAVLPPRFAMLYKNQKHDELKKLAQLGAFIGTTLGTPLFLLFFFSPDYLMRFYGPEFANASDMLKILATAHWIRVSFLTADIFLNMTGNEHLVKNINIGCNIFGILLILTLTPRIGAYGPTIALAFTLIFQTILPVIFVRKIHNIWPIPFTPARSQLDR